MAVGLHPPARLLPVAGVRLAATAAGIRYTGRDDLVLMELAPGTQAAAVFTRNRFRAAPVRVAEAHLARAAPRFLLVNAGNANAGTGDAGLDAARRTCALVARRMGCRVEEVLPFSTGVIGEPLPVAAFEAALEGLVAGLDPEGWPRAARAIMTTDTVPKAISCRIETAEGLVTMTGMAKGAGMIRPDMATMLAFVATDAVVPSAELRTLLGEALRDSFNAITVDGDTSTNDACVLLATGASGVSVSRGGTHWEAFAAEVHRLMQWLAQAIVRDAEGATKFVTICVEGAVDRDEARAVAYTVAHSPLVKTAFFASDPNWGRILAAVGRAPAADLDVARVDLWLEAEGEGVRVVHDGGLDPDYREAAGAAVMARPEFTVRIALGRGDASATVWTSDLSHEYVRINAEYRT
jgi:glutamate N-acetyltransferase/amino-acid N-acetyltransferase